MSKESQDLNFVTALATDYKTFRTFMTGSNIGSFSLATTAQDLKGAVAELKAAITAAAGGMPTNASEIAVGVGEIATQAETTTGTDDFRWITPLKLAQKLTAWAQPLNTNLTNLAGIANTSYGRGFLALANQAGLLALLPASSDTVAGIQRNATQAETNAGALDTASVTPLKFQTRLAAYAVPLSYLDTDGTLTANSDTKIATQKALKSYADSLIAANDAMVFKGVIDASANPNYPASNRGDTYRISVAGRIGGASGVVVEAGDILLALTDATASGTQAAVGANWQVIQTNLDGAVVGPATAVSGSLTSFSGTTGKVVQDSGVVQSTDGTLASNSDAKLPTEKAVKTYTGATFLTKAEMGNPEADLVAAYVAAKNA